MGKSRSQEKLSSMSEFRMRMGEGSVKREQNFGALHFFYSNTSEAVPNLLNYKLKVEIFVWDLISRQFTGRDV